MPLEPIKRAEKLSHIMFRKLLYFGCPTNSVWARSYDHSKASDVDFGNLYCTCSGWWRESLVILLEILENFRSQNEHFDDLKSLFGFYIIRVDRGHVCDLLVKYEVHTTIPDREMVPESLKIESKIQYFGLRVQAKTVIWGLSWPTFWMEIWDFTDLELSYEVHTFRIGGGDE